MFTVCPKCGLTLVVTAADLRVAQGYVRCGRCSNVFNALARLSEDRQAAAAAAAQQNGSRAPQQAAPSSPPPPAASSRPQPPQAIAEDEDDEAIPETALEFNPDADVSKVFVEPPPNPEWTAATGSFKAIVLRNEEPTPAAPAQREPAPAPAPPAPPTSLTSPTSVVQAQAQVQAPSSARSGRPAPPPRQAPQQAAPAPTPVPKPAAAQPPSPPAPPQFGSSLSEEDGELEASFDVELDAELLSAGAQARATVQGQQDFRKTTRAIETEDEEAEELELGEDGVTSTLESAAYQRGAVQPKSAPPSKPAPAAIGPAEARSKTRPQPTPNTSRSDFDVPMSERVTSIARPRPGYADTQRSATNLLWTIGSCVLALVLVAQVIHHYRHDLAANSRLNRPLTSLYAALGIPLVPRWDLHAYDVRQLGASVEGTNSGQITVRASVKNSATQAQPLPLLRVTLQDRFGNRIAARDVPPQSYLPRAIPPSSFLSAGQRIDAEMAFVDPGTNAVGFEIDACLPAAGGGISCANDPR